MGVEAGSTNRWKTARERNRLKARYLIQSRVASRVNDGDVRGKSEGGSYIQGHVPASGDAVGKSSAEKDCAMHLPLEKMNIILRHLRAIINNDLSAFSVASLARHGPVLNRPLPAPLSAKHVVSAEKEALDGLIAMYSTALPWEVSKQQHPAQSSQSAESEEPILQQPTTLATSKYGIRYVKERLVPYMRHLRLHRHRQPTIIEYASLLGRHGIVSLLLLGGMDPTVGCSSFTSNGGDGGERSDGGSEEKGEDAPAERASRRVLSLLHSVGNQEASEAGTDGVASTTIPLSIWCYVIRAVVEMRMNVASDVNKDGRAEHCWEVTMCSICERETSLIRFGPPCHHAFCEPCMWKHLVDTLPLCDDLRRNVVTCPKCCAEFDGFQCQEGDQNYIRQKERRGGSAREVEEKKDEEVVVSFGNLNLSDTSNGGKQHHDKVGIPPLELRQGRCIESLSKFRQLPANSTKMKRKKNKRRKDRDPLHSTWHDALLPAISACQTRDVRSERFFRAVTSSPHLLLGYLNAGVDVNAQNVYGQTALYVACWKGPVVAVRWLLEYGADISIAANGGSTCHSVAAKYERNDVLQLLVRFVGTQVDSANSIATTMNQPSKPPRVSVLIDPTVDHPGAGACLVDDALSEEELQQLVALWRSLPKAGTRSENEEEDSFGRGSKTNSDSSTESSHRPSRSYFCDAEKRVQSMLEGCVEAARQRLSWLPLSEKFKAPSSANSLSGRWPPTSVLEHIRFLSYERPGGILPPHVDLCRVDDASGLRSTHTFILYLTDCVDGGGTALLNSLKDGQVLAVAQPKRGRALIFPHLCPHSGLEVGSAPKLLLRGEVLLDLPI